MPNIVLGKVARHQPVPEDSQHRGLTPSTEFSGVRAYTPHLRRWVDAARIEDGALFRRVDRWGRAGTKPMNPDSVRLVLARLAATAGMVGTPLEPISPHGLRAGFITTAYGNGVSDERIMEHTRQKSLETMRGYVRRARLDRDSPAGNVGL